jgi:hypothetical protein
MKAERTAISLMKAENHSSQEQERVGFVWKSLISSQQHWEKKE